MLNTVYSEKMNTACPLADYPRPSMVRDSYICLNGEWDFAFSDAEPEKYTEKILVPFCPESQLSGINRSHTDKEKLYYRRRFTVPSDFKKDRIILHFGAIDQLAEIRINGSPAGEHEGGYIPFSIDITDFLKDGDNEITVIATDTLSHLYPYGKQRKDRGGMWYTPVSGIWQTVWMESLPKDPIRSIQIEQTSGYAKIKVDTDAQHLKLTLSESGEVIESDSREITVAPKNPKLWSPESPTLYRFTLESETDKIESYFALRQIGKKKCGEVTRLTLNGEPYLFNGLLDQGYFPDGIYLPASYDGYRDDILTAKRLGFNTLRKHIKIEPQIFYYYCDLLGMAVFQDIPNNSDYSFIRDTALPTVGMKRLPDKRLHRDPISRRIFLDTMRQTIALLHNHPSVLYYTVFNEGWGQFCADSAYTEAKQLDSSRIIDATSGWFTQKLSDVDSQHVYFKRLKAKIDPKKPCVISEFGGYSYRCPGHLFGEKNYGYKNFDSAEAFESAIVSLYENEVIPIVKKGVSALIYTQVSDVEDETNGFLTYDRKVLKCNPETMMKISNKLKESIL